MLGVQGFFSCVVVLSVLRSIKTNAGWIGNLVHASN